MRKIIKRFLFIAVCISILFLTSACDSSPVSKVIIANEQYSSLSEIDKAVQPSELSKGSDVYASVYFIESPEGMKYSVDWIMDGKVLKSEEKAMTTNRSGVIIFNQESASLNEGMLTLDIKYKNESLFKKEIQVK